MKQGSYGLSLSTLSAGANGDLAGMMLNEYNSTNCLVGFKQIAPTHTLDIIKVNSSINALHLKNLMATSTVFSVSYAYA